MKSNDDGLVIVKAMQDVELMDYKDPTNPLRHIPLKKDFYYKVPRSWYQLMIISKSLYFYFKDDSMINEREVNI